MMLALTVNGIHFYNHYQFLSIKRSTFFTFGQYVYSPIHTLLKLLSLCGVNKKVRREKSTFPFFMQQNTWVSGDEISLN